MPKQKTMPSKLLFFLLSWLMLVSFEAVDGTETKPGCQSKCGNLNIPYPFGVGPNCSIGGWANIYCNTTFKPSKPFIGTNNLELVQISESEVRIKNIIASTCYNPSGALVRSVASWIQLIGTPYTFSSTKNKVTVIGCDTYAISSGNSDGKSWSGCISVCGKREDVIEGSCSTGCCQNAIPQGLKEFYAEVSSLSNHTKVSSFDPCGAAFLAEEDAYKFKVSDFRNISSLVEVPVVLNFGVGNRTCKEARSDTRTFACKENSYCYDSVDHTGYLCNCSAGYKGNPYLSQGCRDVNECEDPSQNPCKGICTNKVGSYYCSCPDGYQGDGTKEGSGCTKKNKTLPLTQLILGTGFGLLFLLAGGSWSYLAIKKRNLCKLKEQFFQQNGGLLLKQQISSRDRGVDSTKIFTTKELKLATNNYDQNRILGQGGCGTVYKGILPDLRLIAIKKSKLVDTNQIGEFINEVVILTQINHRNVVKLLGCCLETQVPLLVYEFVSNGTLYDHLHKRSDVPSPIFWEDRLRIAAETAGALAYLHSAASIPIFHRDVKSANILLDDNYIAKVGDFGASRLNPLDENQRSTAVQGTTGYLDPESLVTGQLTDKSDVYSFGVVLVELLTGEKPFSSERSQEEKCLVVYFMVAVKENDLSKILDAKIVNEGKMEQAHTVAGIAMRCLNFKGEERPSMKEVAAELEGLRGFEKHSFQGRNEEKGSFDLYSTTESASGQYSTEKEMILPKLNLAR